MKFDPTRPQKQLGKVLVSGTIAIGWVSALVPGCGGGDNNQSSAPPDGGSDGTMAESGAIRDAGPETSSDSGRASVDSGEPDATLDSGEQASGDSGPEAATVDSGLEAATVDSGPEASVDSGEPAPGDSGEEPPSDSGGEEASADAGSDASDGLPVCGPAASACTGPGITAGLCLSGTCSLCNDPSDDSECASAYGSASTPYICGATGACVKGNCHTDTDCATRGQICGVTTANACGPCTTDAECQTDPSYGPGTICDTTAGVCSSAACTTTRAACSNPADFCCPNDAGVNACVPGSCCTNADCTNGTIPICGGGGPNVCGKCSLDSQCAANEVCSTGTGQCVSSTCTGPGIAGGAPAACAANPMDMCCVAVCTPNPAKAPAVACCPGPSGDTFCKGSTGLDNTSATCSSGDVCTTCAAVSPSTPVYVVDPVNGSDSGTGSAQGGEGGAQASCALKTVTRAFQLISVVGTAIPTKVVIVGGASVMLAAAEVFPLVIPENVSLTTEAGPVTVLVPNGKAAFVLENPNSSITSGGPAEPMTITTTLNATAAPPTGGTNGIQVTGNATSASTTISDVTVNGMLDDGILVQSGSVLIGAGVTSSNNGIASSTRAGLHVTGTGAATIDVPSGSAPTLFAGNTAYGILVDTNGSIDLSGVVTSASAGTGTVVTRGNVLAGVWIQQTPGPAVPENVIDGLVSFANTGGNGMRIVAGSYVQVRNSVFLENLADGLIISTSDVNGVVDNDVSKIDLGSLTTNGGNTFQTSLAAGTHNGGAGICLATAASGVQLSAIGNQFSAANCATTGAPLTLNANGCTNSAQACPSGVCDLGLQGGTGTANTFLVSMCTQ